MYFTIDDPAKATVSPAQASSSPQTLTLTGVAKGHTALRARVGSSSGPICKTLTNPATNSAAHGDSGIGSWNLELGKGHGHSCPCHGLENPFPCFAI
ncbi:MAG: hypothetical protein ACOX5G_10445 [Kiritimatiellia bacterium]